jgi:hypothetical protein
MIPKQVVTMQEWCHRRYEAIVGICLLFRDMGTSTVPQAAYSASILMLNVARWNYA